MRKKQTLPIWAFPLALMALAALTYGPLLSQFGFYWDDWVFAWTRAQLGAQGLRDLFAVTRPIRGWTEALLTPVLGLNPFAWQVYALLMRWLAVVSFWGFLRQVWPTRRAEGLFAAGVLLVYPGFSQQPLAMTYHYYWTFAAVFFLSLRLMARSLSREKTNWWLYTLALALSALQLSAMEYLVGLELLRPFVLLLALAPQFPLLKERLKRAVLYEIPFALVLGAYLYWRFFLYIDAIYSPALLGEASSNLASTVSRLLGSTLNAISAVNLQAWLAVIQLPSAEALGPALSVVYLLVVFAILAGWALLLHKADEDASQPVFWSWILFGLGGMLVAGLPFFIAGLPFRLTFPEDRFTLPFIPLAGIFLAGMLTLLPSRSRQFLVAALFLALAAGYQINSCDLFRTQAKIQKSFFWQLSWRAPGLKPGTAILSDDTDTFRFDDDEALTTPLNWMYAPDQHIEPFPYQYQFISLRFEKMLDGLLASPQTSQAVVVRYAAKSCLHVLDPVYDQWLSSLPHAADVAAASALGLPVLPAWTLRALPLSNPEQILSAAQPAIPPTFFGAEPEHKWCYTYQKADLARQREDWESVASLGDQAFAIPMLPDDPYEYLPFIEAYARLGRVKDARLLTRQVALDMPLLKPGLCAVWARAGQQGTVSAETVNALKSELQICPVP